MGDGFRKQGFEARVFLRILYTCQGKWLWEGVTVERVALENVERTEMGSILEADVAHKGMARGETESTSFVDGYFPTDVPRNGVFVEAFQTGKDTSVLNGVLVVEGQTFECLFTRLIVGEVLLPTVAPCAPTQPDM